MIVLRTKRATAIPVPAGNSHVIVNGDRVLFTFPREWIDPILDDFELDPMNGTDDLGAAWAKEVQRGKLTTAEQKAREEAAHV